MRTVRCSGRLTRGGDVCPGGCTPPRPVDKILDTRLLKHYFPQLLLRKVTSAGDEHIALSTAIRAQKW